LAVKLTVSNRQVADVSVVQLEGRIVLGEESSALREQVNRLLAESKQKIVLHLEKVSYIDSAGLGALVAAFRGARDRGARLKLCSLSPQVRHALEATRLTRVLEIFDNESAAAQSFEK